MIIELANSPVIRSMHMDVATEYLNDIKRWCFANLGNPGDRWQVTFSPNNAMQFGALPLELIIPDEHDALLVKLKFGL